MKLQTFLDYLISISLFLIILFIVFFFFFSSIINLFDRISSTSAIYRSLAISQQLIYYNGSLSISEILGFNIGRYNELNFTKVREFIGICNMNKTAINNLFVSSDFYLKIGNMTCFSSFIESRVKRVIVINNQIELLEIGIKI